MKKKINILLLSFMILIGNITFSQVPEGINYQALIRNTSSGALIPNGTVNVKIKIISGTTTGSVAYQELHNGLLTNQGLVNLVIGKGLPQIGTFASIPWSSGGVFYVNTSIQIVGSGTYVDYGTQQLMSVPFALYSKNSGNQLNQWRYGNSIPSSGLGNLGDYYLDMITGNVHYKNSVSTWQLTGNIKGPQGAQGIVGAQGVQGLNGSLINGTSVGNTPFWDGAQWVVNSSNIFNNGTSVGIGTTSPNASAKLEIASTTQGFLLPRMSNAQRDAITSPTIGLVIYNTTTNCLNFFTGTNWSNTCGTTMVGYASIDCSSITNYGSLLAGISATGVSCVVPYTGGNGGTYNSQTISSTGVSGLIASIAADTFTIGNGSITINISGIPSSPGYANFAINLGGQLCSLILIVYVAPPSQYQAGTVFCTSTPTTVVEVYSTATGKIWMDRNLGATNVANSIADVTAYGDLYQWGRFSDGHQCRTSTTTTALSSSLSPGNPNFIISSSTPYDWINPPTSHLWQGVNGINNPCPTGFRLPTMAEFESEYLSWGWGVNGYNPFTSILKLTYAGFRLDGILNQVNTSGAYWTSSYSGNSSRFLSFSVGNSVSNGISLREYGFTVRCIKN
jgi:hypothetical protein